MSFGPRILGTAGHAEVEKWIAASLETLGWETTVHTVIYRGVELRNLVGKRGASQDGPIVIGAHYDTRPKADRDPVDPARPVPGANDGASGVAILLELAHPPLISTGTEVWLTFFDGEESGGLGVGVECRRSRVRCPISLSRLRRWSFSIWWGAPTYRSAGRRPPM